MEIRRFLGHTIFDFDQRYALQTIKDNVSLLTPEVLDEINQVVVTAAHKKICGDDEVRLKGRCDSFVLETDVHYPTDINLLWDAIQKIIFLVTGLCSDVGITRWRQHRHILKKIKKRFNALRRLKRSTSKDEKKKAIRDQLIMDAHREYVDLVGSYVLEARTGIAFLNELSSGDFARILMIEKYFCPCRAAN